MRIFDLYSKVAELPDGEYFFVNKNFFAWKICVVKKDFELTKKYFYQGTEELDFEETSEKYRFFCAMMQSDTWEMLRAQLSVMCAYMSILEERADFEDIDLSILADPEE